MRIDQYFRRADIRRDPIRLGGRRLLLEAERRFSRERYGRDRIVRIDGDVLMSVSPADEIERAIYLFGLYEYSCATAFKRLVRPGMTVVDAGAHAGQYTLLAAKRTGREGTVVAVEPNPRVRVRLERNVRLNHFENVHIEGSALAESPGRAHLYLPRSDNSGIGTLTPTSNAEAIEVTTVRLDDLLGTVGYGRLDVLKMDVEGAEPHVIAGGMSSIERHRPAILFEANDLLAGDPTAHPVVRVLGGLGYEMWGIRSEGITKLAGGEDLRAFRDYWQTLNLLALHAERVREFTD